ncbi:MAG: septal ring lytic transglycosylase RlpA family protein [Xanthomonadales bacterium]|nr:septal ring lytic transglycosylase RlpA family protein [Xanthomonadales bacterium]
MTSRPSTRAALWLLLFATLLLGACSRQKKPPPPVAEGSMRSERAEIPDGQLYAPEIADSAPEHAPDLSDLVEPTPRTEPRSRYGNHSPYKVLGRTYRVMDSAKGYVERGVASWYGKKFHGRPTSSFEPYDMYAFTAAHKTLPLPTYVRVTNLENQRSVVLRVNDRGPFVADRLIDLSYAAAMRLGVVQRGTAMVEVRALDVDDPDHAGVAEPAPESTVKASVARVWLQLGSFSDRRNAERLRRQLEGRFSGEATIQTATVEGRRLFRLRMGPWEHAADAVALERQIRDSGIADPRIITD